MTPQYSAPETFRDVLQTLLTLPAEYEIKILITVRDYARKRVINTVSKYTTPEVIEIGRLTDEEIKDILKADLGIRNPDYLKKISEIANGNARLAFLAGIRSVDEGYQAIRNAEDIFRNYYGRILSESHLTKLIDVVVNVMPHWKQDFILEYLKDNQNVEDFKKIHLFPMSASWSGSEVPLIIDKIQFLQSLKEKLKGLVYIEHREYIEECRRNLEEYKRKVELSEYLEEADYA